MRGERIRASDRVLTQLLLTHRYLPSLHSGALKCARSRRRRIKYYILALVPCTFGVYSN